ncbi:hypothetical protein [Amycolatopsis sp. NPDC003861]
MLTELLQVSESDVRRAIGDAQVRVRFKEDQNLPASDVVARLLAARLVRKLPPGTVRLTKMDLRLLSRKVEHVLGSSPGSATTRFKPRTSKVLRQRQAYRPRPTSGRYVTTAKLAGITVDDVRRAAENIQSRNPEIASPAEIPVSDVVTDLLTVHLASHLKADPDSVNVHGDDVRGLADEVQGVLAAGPAESPWRTGIGPVLRSETACTLLGLSDPEDLAKQAAAKMILMLTTSDGHSVLPSYQFTADGLIPGLPEVLHAVAPDDAPLTWTVASWLRSPLQILGDRSIIDMLLEGDVHQAVDAARLTAARWAV